MNRDLVKFAGSCCPWTVMLLPQERQTGSLLGSSIWLSVANLVATLPSPSSPFAGIMECFQSLPQDFPLPLLPLLQHQACISPAQVPYCASLYRTNIFLCPSTHPLPPGFGKAVHTLLHMNSEGGKALRKFSSFSKSWLRAHQIPGSEAALSSWFSRVVWIIL